MSAQKRLKSSTFLVTATVLMLSSAAAMAQSFGYVSATGAFGRGANVNDNDDFTSLSPKIEGVYAFSLAGGGTIVVDAMVQFDSYDDEITGNVASLPMYQANASYLKRLSDTVTVGGYVGYGVAPFDDADRIYQVATVGGSAVFNITDTIDMFAQGGFGTSFDPDIMDSAGFYNGISLRAGVIFTGMDAMTIRGEFEFGASAIYEDDNEPGEFWSMAVIGEYELAGVAGLSVLYSLRYASFDALDDSDTVQETTASLGVKYAFGGGTAESFGDIGYIGTPYLPLRASFWTPAMD